MTKSIQFEIISRGSILQNYSHEPDIFSELQKCDNSEIKQFVNEYENNRYNYKKNPNFIVTVIREEFPETLEYYKVQLFLSQLFKDLADQTSIIKKKESYKKYSDKYLKKGKNTEKICVNALHVSNQIEDIHENTDEKIIECEKYYHKYEDPNFLLTKGNLESINSTEEAIKTFKEGTQKFEDDKRFNNNLANMYMSIEEFDTAKKYYTNIDKISSSDNLQEEEIFWNNIGCMYSQINEIEKAEFYFNKAIRKNPKNFMAWYNGGIHKMLSGDTAGAEKNLEKSYKLNKNHHLTGINYAQALIKNGNKEKARGIVKKISPYQNQQTELFSNVRDSLENNPQNTLREKIEKWDIGPHDFRKQWDEGFDNKGPYGIIGDIKKEFTRIRETNYEKDQKLFQRLVTVMQKHDTSTSKVLANELADVRQEMKLTVYCDIIISNLELEKLDHEYLIFIKEIRKVAIIQKLLGQKSIYNLLNKLKRQIFAYTDNPDNIAIELDSKGLIKISNSKLKSNKNDVDALETIIFAYVDLDDFENAIKYSKKLAKIEPKNEYTFLSKIPVDNQTTKPNKNIEIAMSDSFYFELTNFIKNNTEVIASKTSLSKTFKEIKL